ncbi:MAG TPA: MAPEG family protein [Polyangiaceae bacterium]|nr:MAPEG family protein [Polyangiaceae bacterium]
MDTLSSNPTFVVYVVVALMLCANVLFLWSYSGAVRGKTKTAINPEDAARFGAALADVDPPEVARVLRAHRNAQAAIYPFLFLGLVFVLLGGSAGTATIIFGTFVVARILHSVVYLGARQPWRTLFFVAGALATGALMVDILVLLVRASGH